MFRYTFFISTALFVQLLTLPIHIDAATLSSRQEKKYLKQVQKAFQTKQFNQCASIINQLIENEKDRPEPSKNYPLYITAQSYFYYYSGSPQQAKENIYHLLETEQEDEILYYNSALLAEILSGERDSESCYDILRHLDLSVPSHEWELHIQNLYKTVSKQLAHIYDYELEQAKSAFDHKDYSRAKEHYSTVFNSLLDKRYLNNHSVSYRLHTLEETAYRLGLCLGYDNQWKEVIKTLTKAPTLLSEDPRQNSLVTDAVLLLSKAYRKNGLYNESITTLLTLSSMDPTIQDANTYLLELALSYFYYPNTNKALVQFEKLAARRSNTKLLPLINYYIAQIYLEKKENQKAQHICDQLLADRRSKTTTFAKLLQAQILYKNRQDREALNILETILLYPKKFTHDLLVDAHLLAHEVYQPIDYNQSIHHLKTALALSSRDDLFIHLLDHYFISYTQINPYDKNQGAATLLDNFDPLSDDATTTAALYRALLQEDSQKKLEGLYQLTIRENQNKPVSFKAYWHAGNIFYGEAKEAKGKDRIEKLNSAIDALEIALQGFEEEPVLFFETTLDLADALVIEHTPEATRRACTRLQALNRPTTLRPIPKALLNRYHLLFSQVILSMPNEMHQPSFQHDLKDQLEAINSSSDLQFRLNAYAKLIPIAAHHKSLRTYCCQWLNSIIEFGPTHKDLPLLTYYLYHSHNLPSKALHICQNKHPESLYSQVLHFSNLQQTKQLPTSFSSYLNLLEKHPLSDAYSLVNQSLFSAICQKKFTQTDYQTLTNILTSFYKKPISSQFSLLKDGDKLALLKAELSSIQLYLSYIHENRSKIRMTELEPHLRHILRSIETYKELSFLRESQKREWQLVENSLVIFLN